MDDKIKEYWLIKVANSKGILSEYSDNIPDIMEYQNKLFHDIREYACKIDIDMSKQVYGRLNQIDKSTLSPQTRMELLYELNVATLKKLTNLTSVGKFYGIWAFTELKKAHAAIERDFKALSKKYGGSGSVDSIISAIENCSEFLRKLGTFPKGGESK